MELKPRTRKEFLIADFIDKDIPDIVPKTRAEMFLKQALDKISSGGSGGGVSSWNDLTDKPFYEEGGIVEVLPEYKPAFIDNGMFPITEPFVLALGERYTVNLNGTEYKGTAIDGGNSGYPGTISLVNDGANLENGTGVVVAVVAYGENKDGGYGLGAYADGSTSVTISIYQNTTVIHPIEGKYLPKGTPWISESVVEALPETSVDISEGAGVIIDPINVNIGSLCVVTYNGVEYDCEAQELELEGVRFAVLGDTDAMLGEPSGSHPFAVAIVPVDMVAMLGAGAQVYALDGSETVSVSIKEVVASVNKLDNRCLDLAWLPTIKEKAGEVLCAIENMALTQSPTNEIRYYGETEQVIPLTNGAEYLVTWNGKQFKCVAVEDNTQNPPFVAIGSVATMSTEVFGDEPFCIVTLGGSAPTTVVYSDYASEVTFTVQTLNVTANKMPAKFLPDDATSFTLVSPNGTKYAVTVSDSGTLSATAI